MKSPARHERTHPFLAGVGLGLMLAAVAFGTAEVFSPQPKHTAVWVAFMVAVGVGCVLTYVGSQPKRTGGLTKTGRRKVDTEEQGWMAHIDREVRAVCEAQGWGHQIRRKWSVRERPVSESPIDHYEWKLIPDAHGRLPDAQAGDFDGVYYVLWFDKPNGRFVFQHDTEHVGIMGPHWEVETYTEIRPTGKALAYRGEHRATPGHPPVGWLRDHLQRLITSFRPNSFSRT